MKTIPKEDLESLFSKIRNGSRNHIISTCPFCGKDDHFYINRVSQQWDCKKCGEDGNIFKLLIHLGKLYLIGDFKSIERTKIKLLSEYSEEQDEKISTSADNRKLPLGFKRIFKNDYLNNRKITKSNFENNIIGISNLIPSLKNYVIFSVDEQTGCKGYLSRYTKIISPDEKKFILRYKNDKGANFSKLLYGFHKVVKKTKTIILVEGLIDKLTLDNFLNLDSYEDIVCCATFGKKISQFQILKMLEAGVENVILIFDYDAIKEMKKFSLELDKFFNVEIGFTFKKDINDSNEFEIGQIFENLKNVRNFNKKTVKLL